VPVVGLQQVNEAGEHLEMEVHAIDDAYSQPRALRTDVYTGCVIEAYSAPIALVLSSLNYTQAQEEVHE
jgi:hypothetical protein